MESDFIGFVTLAYERHTEGSLLLIALSLHKRVPEPGGQLCRSTFLAYLIDQIVSLNGWPQRSYSVNYGRKVVVASINYNYNISSGEYK